MTLPPAAPVIAFSCTLWPMILSVTCSLMATVEHNSQAMPAANAVFPINFILNPPLDELDWQTALSLDRSRDETRDDQALRQNNENDDRQELQCDPREQHAPVGAIGRAHDLADDDGRGG